MYNYNLQEPSFYKVGLYIRLSEADSLNNYESESESIINQRNLLMNFVKQNKFTLVDEYVDDGFTGTNFNRPGFKRLIQDIESKRINCVITKDLSRLGRDYIKCGYYVEQYFPQKKIRYISILDNVDTFLETANNDIAPFKTLFNDMTSKDISKKIRSILKNKKEQGKFIGSTPSFGYKRDPKDKGHLIPDLQTNYIVKEIFKMAYEGIHISDIASYLNNKKYPTPSYYKRKENSKQKYTTMWTISSVKKILNNQMYLGDMIQNVQTKLSYKSPQKITLGKESWIIVKNTHEPLVSREVFNKIKYNNKRTIETVKHRKKRLFENLLYCKECGNTLSVSYRKNNNYWTINCNRYSRDPKRHLCYSHFIPYDKLESALLEVIENTYKKYIKEINIKEILEKIKFKISSINDSKYYEKEIKELINLKNPSRKLLQTIIDKIIIDKDRNIEIIYNFNIKL